MDIQRITALDLDVAVGLPVEVQAGQIDFHARGLAAFTSNQDHRVGAARQNAPGGCQDFGEARAALLQREAPRTTDAAKHRNLLASILGHVQCDLGALHEATVLQAGRDQRLGLTWCESAHPHGADQRKREFTGLRNSGLSGHVGTLKNLDANHIAGPQGIVE